MRRKWLTLAVFLTGTASAAQMELSVQVPQLNVAEYHRPYVAAWVEDANRQTAAQLLLWYQQDKKNAPPGAEQGSKWLPDLRQWWRRGGRELSLPMDGVSGASRAVGVYVIRYTDQPPVPTAPPAADELVLPFAMDGLSHSREQARLPHLAAGQYTLRIEAAREEGGRELLELPFSWPPQSAQQHSVSGKSELGDVRLNLIP
ncbi:DUF2271 domain-containing protein [Sinimarinibacterium sp. NLF-5-8]|uniref:DUF2271 domain-containing protein n=1 Tax=Sinimarinibacterium sp. NLF-5-8 TaxID=2698684 RepID=UPI00137BFB43|nr:DUF2271 domain-containing protein [Sinimarinibacterium sp. NLF-5-8]QHS08947.1 DUF2271 domain-containing protein [Sinimarinibacterium sp. NLF-5-8]